MIFLHSALTITPQYWNVADCSNFWLFVASLVYFLSRLEAGMLEVMAIFPDLSPDISMVLCRNLFGWTKHILFILVLVYCSSFLTCAWIIVLPGCCVYSKPTVTVICPNMMMKIKTQVAPIILFIVVYFWCAQLYLSCHHFHRTSFNSMYSVLL